LAIAIAMTLVFTLTAGKAGSGSATL